MDENRFAASGAAGHQHVGQVAEICVDQFAGNILAEGDIAVKATAGRHLLQGFF